MILDGNSMLFRAYYATLYTHRMSTSEGLPTSAVYGFVLMLNKAIEVVKPDAILVAWDADKKTFRHEKYDAYKGTRKPLDEDLKLQFPIIREFLDAAGIMRYEISGYEADDIIGSMAKSNPTLQTTILSSDRDLLQLIDSTTHALMMKKGITDMELMNEETFKEKYGLEPIQMIDLKGLMGDASDNIPGVAGIGEKTGVKLLAQYHTVEGVYENIDAIKGKLKEKLVAGKESALMSKDLATIYTKMDLPFTAQDCAFTGYKDSVNDFFLKYEMKSLMIQTEKEESHERECKKVSTWPIQEENPILLCVCDTKSYLEQTLYGFMGIDQDNIYFESVEDALEDKNIKKVLKESCIYTWDAKEMMHALDSYGFPLPKKVEDMHIASFLTHSNAKDTDALLSALEISVCETFHELSKKKKDEDDKERAIKVYADFIEGLSLKREDIYKQLEQEECTDLYNNIEMPLVPILFEMEREGIHIDEDILDQIGNQVKDKIEEIANKIYQQAGMVFNINSPKQLGNVLFDELNLTGGGKKRSTSAEVLEKLKGTHPIIDLLLEYRKYAKISSTYIDGLKKHIQKDQKIHTCFNQTMTQTGRLSSSEPNLQNISVRDEEGKEIRKAFTAPEGYYLVSADYSQIELRMLAHMAQESHMMEAFKEGVDVHTKTATLIFNVDKEAVDERMRRIAKTVNFGIVYGQTEHGLSQQLKITRKEATEFMNSYFENYPNISEYMDSLVEYCKENGYVKTIFNRRRMIPEINDKNFMTREFGKRAAMNAPIQGSAADLIKIAMIKVKEAMEKAQVESKMLLQIHDELIFLVPEKELEQMISLVKEAMEHAVELSVPLSTSVAYGKRWYEAK